MANRHYVGYMGKINDILTVSPEKIIPGQLRLKMIQRSVDDEHSGIEIRFTIVTESLKKPDIT